jgi:hypothetical protein
MKLGYCKEKTEVSSEIQQGCQNITIQYTNYVSTNCNYPTCYIYKIGDMYGNPINPIQVATCQQGLCKYNNGMYAERFLVVGCFVTTTTYVTTTATTSTTITNTRQTTAVTTTTMSESGGTSYYSLKDLINRIMEFLKKIFFFTSNKQAPVTTTTNVVSFEPETTIHQTATTTIITTTYQSRTTTPSPMITTTTASVCIPSSGTIDTSTSSFFCDADECELSVVDITQKGGCYDMGVRLGSNEFTCKIVHLCDPGDSCHITYGKIILHKGEYYNFECNFNDKSRTSDWSYDRCGMRPNSMGVLVGVSYKFNYVKKCGNYYVTPTTTTTIQTDLPFMEEYKQSLIANNIPSIYLSENYYYDYSNPDIQKVINEIKAKSYSVNDLINYGANYVRSMPQCAGTPCFKLIPASQVLKEETGMCSTKSRLLIAIYRGMGLAARGVSGRLCNGVDHAWVDVWDGTKWRFIETTSVNQCYNIWGYCGDGQYTGIPDEDMKDNNCYSQTLRKFIPCDDWAKECAWVADSFTPIGRYP